MEAIGRYEILQRLAQGGMAEVFLCRTTGEGGFEKLVAIKRILPHMAEKESFVKMFIDEARISAKLNHSSIGQIFEFGRVGETYFIAMEYIHGVDLRAIHKFFRSKKQLPPPPFSAHIIGQVCAALEHAHTKCDNWGKSLGIIHRDVSPSNVLTSFEGEVKLIDFGIAKATQRIYETVGANLKGKYSYMSPEQALGNPVDQRSDLYGAGILLFELLTGKNPFRAETDIETLRRVQDSKFPSPAAIVPGTPAEIDAICMKALARNPPERYQTAGELLEALEGFSRTAGFGTRQLARWMKESFPEELESTHELLRKARERPADSPIKVIPTDEVVNLRDQSPGPVEDAPLKNVPSSADTSDPDVTVPPAGASGPLPLWATPQPLPPTPTAPWAGFQKGSPPSGVRPMPHPHPHPHVHPHQAAGGAGWSPPSSSHSGPHPTPTPHGMGPSWASASSPGSGPMPLPVPHSQPTPTPGSQPTGPQGPYFPPGSTAPPRPVSTVSPLPPAPSVGRIIVPIAEPGAPGESRPLASPAPDAYQMGPSSTPPRSFAATASHPESRGEPDLAISLPHAPMNPYVHHRSDLGLHVVLFIAITCIVGVLVYFFLVRPLLSKPTPTPSGSIQVSLDPPNAANVLVDGEQKCELGAGGVCAIDGVLPGKHRVLLSGTTFKTVEGIVEVHEGRTTQHRVKVEPVSKPGP
jgi:eukaryotic-like serine/threonine-protein kinase